MATSEKKCYTSLLIVISFMALSLSACYRTQSALPLITDGGFAIPSEHQLTVTTGKYKQGSNLSAKLQTTPGVVVSRLSQRVLENMTMDGEVITYQGIVIRLEDMGFTGPVVTYEEIMQWGLDNGFGLAPKHLAPYIRLQFKNQPNWDTGNPLGEFFVVSKPITLKLKTEEITEFRKVIFSVLRDDAYPAPDSGKGLHLIANGVANDRKFRPNNPGPYDYNNHFLFLLKK